VKADSGAHAIIKESKTLPSTFSQRSKRPAFTFSTARARREFDRRRAVPQGNARRAILEKAPAFVECALVDTIEKGDHPSLSVK